MKILVVEDDPLVREALTAILTYQNYAVETAADGKAAKDLIETYDYDLILLDVILPKLDGISLCRQIRDLGLLTPILLLTGRDSSHEKAVGLNAGADDYLVKPFDEEELIARIHALLRRGTVSQPILTVGELRLDPTSCKVTYCNKTLNLTPKEYALVELFMRNSKRVFSCGMILEHLWSYEEVPGEEAVRTHIKGLRQKLKAAGAPNDLIETVYGIGYRLKLLQDSRSEESKSTIKTDSTEQKTISSIAAIWDKYKARFDEQVNILAQAAETLIHNNLNPELRSSAQKEAHSLAGSLGTFGFDKGSKIARKFEKILQSDNLNKSDGKKLRSLVDALLQVINESSQLKQDHDKKEQNELPLILVVDNEPLVIEQVSHEAINRGLQVTTASDINSARTKFYNEHPNVVLLDPSVSSNWTDVNNLFLDLKQRKPPVPAIVFTEKTDFANRLQVARGGGNSFLQKPATPVHVLDIITQVLHESNNAEAKILAVDDDPKILAILQTLLAPWGLKVHTLDNPQNFWEVLEAIKPDLLILDVEMPEVNGIELCQVVRNDPNWSDLPIVFLTVHTDADIVNQVFTIGADDFVSKPIIGPELVTRIINRLERNRLLHSISKNQSNDHDCSYWRTIFNAEPECVKLVAQDGTLLEMNPAGLAIVEAEQVDDVIGKNVYSLIAPEFHDAFQDLNQKIFTGTSGTLEFEIITCKENRRWLQTHAVPLQQSDGTIVLLGITRDISQCKQAKADISKISRIFKTLSACNQAVVRAQNESDLLHNVCNIITSTGGYKLAWVGFTQNSPQLTVNIAAQSGYDSGYLQSLNLNLDDISQEPNATTTAISTGKTFIVQDIQDSCHNQDVAWVSEARKRGFAGVISLPLVSNNQPFGAISIYAADKNVFDTEEIKLLEELAADLSYGIMALRQKEEREHVEAALRKSEELLQQANQDLELRVSERTSQLVQTNHNLQSELEQRLLTQQALRNSQALFAGIVNIADDAIISIDKNQCITLFNSGAEKIFGYSASEVIGKHLNILLPNRYTQIHSKYVEQFGASPNQSRRMAERQEIYARRKDGTEFPAEASISKLNLGDDIIYTVYLQDISERKQIERMKDEFVSVVSHELRTPLTSIHGSLGMLASGLIKSESEQGKRLLQIATDSTERLVRLINDILDIERIESGKVKMEKQICNLADLIAQAVNIMQPLADKAQVSLSITNLSINVWADPDRIIQTLTNLLSNAIKFSKPNSTVYLEAIPQESEVVLNVRDTGRGVPKDKLETIFERFQQVDASDSRRQDGTGLGLAICKSIVQQHDGRIWVESVVDEGSSFYFTLPISKLPTIEIQHPTNQEAPSILICDDDARIISQLKMLLEEKGYLVLTADSGEVAIELAVNQHPDVILLDLVMPGMNGWEVMGILKQRQDTKDIPIVICSFCTPDNYQQLTQDFAEWICKPVRDNSLLRSLSQVLGNPKQVRVLIVEDDENLAPMLTTLLKSYGVETFLAKTAKEAIRTSQEVNPDLIILDLLPELDGFNVVEWLQQHNRLYNIPLLVYSTRDLNDVERNRLKLGHTEFLTKGQTTEQEFEQKVMDLIGQLTQNRLSRRLS
ncbi:MAG: response regulator [Calothrix sp. C42_A2020_038]|nr:response regulator [Calothrix sp. C42_A2020_038]